MNLDTPLAASLPDERLAKAGAQLKHLASNATLNHAFETSAALREAFSVAASRYVLGEDSITATLKLAQLARMGYEVGIEQVGEDVRDEAQVARVAAEYHALIDSLPAGGLSRRMEINFDLSNVGLLLSRDLALQVSQEIAQAAHAKGLYVTLSMERLQQVDDILWVFHRLAGQLPNMGLTLQAYLHRSQRDLDGLVEARAKVRLVKGVYNVAHQHGLPRSPELDQRYLAMGRRLVEAGVPRTFATQDARLVDRLRQGGLLGDGSEVEMLHGVTPSVLGDLRRGGVACRVYGVYGTRWYLHFMHRLAEAPANVLDALADAEDPCRIRFGQGY